MISITKLKKHGVRALIGLVLTTLFASHAIGLFHIRFITQLDNFIYDARLRATMPNTVDDRIVILDVDENSLKMPELGRWPWSRDKMAKIMDVLFDTYQIKSLGFDVIWAEPDTSSGLGILKRLAKEDLKGSPEFSQAVERLAPKLDFDKIFANSLRDRPIVLGYYFNSNKDATEIGALPDPIFFKDDLANREKYFSLRKGYGANLENLSFEAPMAGHFNPTVDNDGVIRRVPMLAEYKGDYYESLSLSMYRLIMGLNSPEEKGLVGKMPQRIPGATLLPLGNNEPKGAGPVLPIEGIQVGSTIIPVDKGTNLLVPFRGNRDSFAYISLGDVFSGKVPVEKLKGKIAFVGTTAPGLADLRATPVSGLYPGVEVHANLLAGMLDSGSIPFKSEPPFSTLLEFVGLVVIGVVLAIFMAYLPALPAAILFVLSFVVAVATNVMGWQQGYALPLAPFLLLIGLIYFSNVAYGYFVESKNKRQLADLFGQYVPPELVDKMAENPLQYSMAARKHTLTVLFSDVVGFTSISEKLTPSELTEFINEYLSEMSFVIRKKGGTLDKYIGDAIMAFWGAPIDDEDHATNGVLAALGMHEKLQELKKAYKEKNWPDINVGIGLSTGPMTVGDMGSVIRKAYTVMGDAVNLGSRLEGITRQYFVNILVSEETMCATKGILFRDIDMVRVKGKDNPITIYEPIAELSKSSTELQQKINTWNEMIKSYRLQNWSDAESKLHGLISADSNNKLYQLYADRIQFFKTNLPPTDWDGVTKFETK